MPQEKYVQVLPKSWDGRFPFTNDSDEDFVFVWAKKGYLFPARKTVDMMKMAFNATPLEVQQIRKFAARKWAEREFFKGNRYESMRSREGMKDENGVIQPHLGSFNAAAAYSEGDLAEGIQKCLALFPEVSAQMLDRDIERDTQSELKRDDDGEFINKIIDEKKTHSLGSAGEILVN